MSVDGAGWDLPVWKLEDAKARFSEIVRRAAESGPQRVTVRGRDAVVVLSARDYAQLVPSCAVPSLADLFDSLPVTSHGDTNLEQGRWQETIRDLSEF